MIVNSNNTGCIYVGLAKELFKYLVGPLNINGAIVKVERPVQETTVSFVLTSTVGEFLLSAIVTKLPKCTACK